MALKDTYFTISEAAKELRVTRQTLYRWIKTTSLPTEKVGRETLIEKADLEKLKMRKIAEVVDFDSAINSVFIDAIRDKGKYSQGDQITPKGNLVFEIQKKDGTRDIADVLEVEINPTEIKIMPANKFKGKGKRAK
jgi:excisionase family DNA binding protein